MKSASSLNEKIAHIKALYAASRYEDALRDISTLPASSRDTIAILSLAGSCHFSLGNLDLAERRYSRILQKTPDCFATLGNLGIVYRAKRQMKHAIRCFERVVSLAPQSLPAYLDLSNLYRLDRQFEKAEHFARQSIAIDARSDAAFTALGSIFSDFGKIAEAESAFRSALTMNPGSAYNAACLGLLLMSLDRWQEGLPLWEARHRAFLNGSQDPAPNVSFPQWNRESLAGKSLLIWPEQGFGDQIQLVRYIQRLKANGAYRITLICEPALQTLFSTVEGVDAVMSGATYYAMGAPAHDFWTFIFSIPFNLGELPASIPARIPYLRSTKEREEKWRPSLGGSSKKVGLVWKGSSTNSADATRSLPGLGTLEPLWTVPDLTFVSLQKEDTKSDIEREIGTKPIVCLGDKITDFADTAAIVAQLDLVITVDTAVAHLSAALGKKTWVLLPNVAVDWRWKHGPAESPWYPEVLRLFRQPALATDWSVTVEDVVRALSSLDEGRGID